MKKLKLSECEWPEVNISIPNPNIKFQCTIKAPAQAVGGYKLGNTTLALTYKPKWIHRKMMSIFFGVKWVDETFKSE